MTKDGYVNGSDMLLKIGGKACGHCTSHTMTINSETKDRQVKPVASAPASSSLWKNKGVTGLSVSISAEGLCFYKETENGFQACLPMIVAGQSVEVECMERGSDKPYATGKFVVASLEKTDPAQDDSTYSISLENDGVVDFDEAALTNGAEAASAATVDTKSAARV